MSESIQRIEHSNLQPVELTTSVEISVGAKGELKPTVKASIKRYFEKSESVFTPLNIDIGTLKNEVEHEIHNIMDKTGGD